MKTTFFLLFLTFSLHLLSQRSPDIEIPKGVTYHYCNQSTLDSAKALVTKELTETPTYAMNGMIVFVGPVLWTRFQSVKPLNKISGGNVTLRVDGRELSAKMTQDVADSKAVWDALRNEIGKDKFELRNATPNELKYYWSVISFDIDEPLIIVETKSHNYILNLSAKDLKLIWLDEAPR